MPFKDCICFQLGKTLRQITKAYRNEINSYKLTHGQFFMVVAVMEEEGLLPSELAVKTSQDRSTTTGLLDRLEKDGWIERRPDDKDRRSLRIYLTPYGKHHRESVLKISKKPIIILSIVLLRMSGFRCRISLTDWNDNRKTSDCVRT